MNALTNPPQTSDLAPAHRLAPAAAVYRLKRRALRLFAHASSNGVQPVAGSSTQQLHTSSSTNGQQQAAPQQPSRIMRYAGLAADDFRWVWVVLLRVTTTVHPVITTAQQLGCTLVLGQDHGYR